MTARQQKAALDCLLSENVRLRGLIAGLQDVYEGQVRCAKLLRPRKKNRKRNDR